MQFRFGPRTLKVDNSFVREAGAEEAMGKIVVGTKKEDPATSASRPAIWSTS